MKNMHNMSMVHTTNRPQAISCIFCLNRPSSAYTPGGINRCRGLRNAKNAKMQKLQQMLLFTFSTVFVMSIDSIACTTVDH